MLQDRGRIRKRICSQAGVEAISVTGLIINKNLFSENIAGRAIYLERISKRRNTRIHRGQLAYRYF